MHHLFLSAHMYVSVPLPSTNIHVFSVQYIYASDIEKCANFVQVARRLVVHFVKYM